MGDTKDATWKRLCSAFFAGQSLDSTGIYGVKRRVRRAFEFALAVAAALACSYWILGGHF